MDLSKVNTVTAKFEVEKSNSEVKAVIFEPLMPPDIDVLRQLNVRLIEINDGKGWRGGKLDFIEALDFISSVSILSFSPNDSGIESIHALKQLRELQINTYCKTKIDFSAFPLLERCDFLWREGSDSLFECEHLESLVLIKFRRPNLPAEQLRKLQRLQLLDSSNSSHVSYLLSQS